MRIQDIACISELGGTLGTEVNSFWNDRVITKYIKTQVQCNSEHGECIQWLRSAVVWHWKLGVSGKACVLNCVSVSWHDLQCRSYFPHIPQKQHQRFLWLEDSGESGGICCHVWHIVQSHRYLQPYHHIFDRELCASYGILSVSRVCRLCVQHSTEPTCQCNCYNHSATDLLSQKD